MLKVWDAGGRLLLHRPLSNESPAERVDAEGQGPLFGGAELAAWLEDVMSADDLIGWAGCRHGDQQLTKRELLDHVRRAGDDGPRWVVLKR